MCTHCCTNLQLLFRLYSLLLRQMIWTDFWKLVTLSSSSPTTAFPCHSSSKLTILSSKNVPFRGQTIRLTILYSLPKIIRFVTVPPTGSTPRPSPSTVSIPPIATSSTDAASITSNVSTSNTSSTPTETASSTVS